MNRKSLLLVCLFAFLGLLLSAALVQACADDSDCTPTMGENSYCQDAESTSSILSMGTCSCKSGYGQHDGKPYCQPVCNGINAKNESVCGGVGTCVSPNKCECESGFGGDSCQYHTCNNIIHTDPSVCGGVGKCEASDVCDCPEFYDGEFCESFICGGIVTVGGRSNNSTNETVYCSGHGECVGPNECKCYEGYTGDICDKIVNSTCKIVAEVTGGRNITVARSSPLVLYGHASLTNCSSTAYNSTWSTSSSVAFVQKGNNLYIKASAFPLLEASYEFIFKVTNGEVSSSVTVVVNVKLQPLIVNILGGSRAVSVNTAVEIKSSASDPEKYNSQERFAWECKKFDGAACPSGINDVVVAAKDESSLIIPADKTTAEGKYVFSVAYSKDGDKRTPAKSEVSIELLPAGSPKVEFKDAPAVAHYRTLSIGVSTDKVDTFKWIVNGVTVTQGANYTSTKNRLTIAKEALTIGASLKIRYEGTNKVSMAYAEVSVTVNKPPTPGTITITPTTGTALDTAFRFEAEGWTDDQLTPLRYVWVVKYTDGRLFTRSFESTNPQMNIPFMPKGDFKVKVEVYDGLSDSTTSDDSTLSVTQRTFTNKAAKMSALADLFTSFIPTTFVAISREKVSQMFLAMDSILTALRDSSDVTSRSITATDTEIATNVLTSVTGAFNAIKDATTGDDDVVSSFDNSYFQNMGNSLKSLLESKLLSTAQTTNILSLVGSMLAEVDNETKNSLSVDDTLLEVFSTLLNLLASAKQSTSTLNQYSEDLLKYYGRNQVVGTTSTTTLSSMVMVTLKLDAADFAARELDIPASSLSHNVAPKITFPQALADRLAFDGVDVAVARVKILSENTNPNAYPSDTTKTTSVTPTISIVMTNADGVEMTVSGLVNPISISLPASYAAKTGWSVHCRYYSSRWVFDDTLSVTSSSPSNVVCATNHLTMFTATYDKDTVTKKKKNVSRILGLALGIPIPIAFIAFCLLVIGVIVALVVVKKNKGGSPSNNIEMRETNV